MSLLGGVRVLDLTRAWAGPLAGRMLADLGAEVIHIEYAAARGAGVVGAAGFNMTASSDWEWGEMPEPSIRAGLFPDANPGPDPWNRQASFNKLNRSKQSLCVDLHEPEGQKIFRGLVAVSDVVLENYSPRGARSLGVEFEVLRDVNPRIVVVSISGYGHSGPNHDRVALGPIIEAESGLAGLTGYRKGGPNKLGAAMPDAITGLNGAAATIAALAWRDATGAGLHADVSMLESFAAIGGEAFLAASDSGVAPDRRGNRSLRWAPQGAYRCAGVDEWIAITVRSTAEWRRLVEVLDGPPLRDPRFCDPAVRSREQPYIDRIIESWTAGQSKWAAWRQLRGSRPGRLSGDDQRRPRARRAAQRPGLHGRVGSTRYRAPPLPRHTDPLRPAPRVRNPARGPPWAAQPDAFFVTSSATTTPPSTSSKAPASSPPSRRSSRPAP